MSTASVKHPRKSQRLFPLHLTPFEFYMLADDRPEHPMTFIVRLELSGTLDPVSLEDALSDTLERHPLLTAIVKPAKRNMECWVRDELAKVLIRWYEIDEPLLFDQGEFINLREEPGLRVWVQHDDLRTIITAQFHHAVCDGIGSYQFIGDWLYGYAVRTGATQLPDLPHFETTAIRQRFRESFDLSKFLGDDGEPREDWREFNRMEQAQSQPLWRPTDRVVKQSFPGIETAVIGKDDYRRVRQAAQRLGLTPNDWSLVQFFYTLRDWNRSHVSSSNYDAQTPISVLVPMSLRQANDQSLSACNVVTYSIVSRDETMFQDASALCNSIRQEVFALKLGRYESQFMYMVTGIRFHVGSLEQLLDPARCHATGTLANTGDPTKQFYVRLPSDGDKVRCGNLTLESFHGVPPLRSNTRVAVSLFTYRRELTICMRCEPKYFRVDDTRQLLENYTARLRRAIDA